jgi:hypothetical protein
MISDRTPLIDLGFGIKLSDTPFPPDVRAENFVFLDKLILPCRISELSPEQILVVNRYRETLSERDAGGSRALGSRRMFREIIRTFSISSVLEFGCGAFPIAPNEGEYSYACIEFDPVAIKKLRVMGIQVYTPEQFSTLCRGGELGFSEALIASFSMHFRLLDELVSEMIGRVTPGGLVAFNLIAEDGFDILSKLEALSRHGLKLRIMKVDSFARREFLVLGSTNESTIFRPDIERVLLG